MYNKDIKSQIDNGAEKVENAARAAAERISNGTEALATKVSNTTEKLATKIGHGTDALAATYGIAEEKVKEYGTRILDNAKDLTNQAREQARLHPLAAFGIAFAAGVIVARVLRR